MLLAVNFDERLKINIWAGPEGLRIHHPCLPHIVVPSGEYDKTSTLAERTASVSSSNAGCRCAMQT